MRNLDRIALHEALAELEQAMLDHTAWHENLLRSIVCAVSFDLRELTERAHLQCGFGRWYYERAPAALWGQPAFAEIGREHEHLHQVAARLLQELASDAPIGIEDFDQLLAGSARLRAKLDALHTELEAALRSHDIVTGAYGRGEMLPELREWHELARRRVQPCCIAFMDLDRFKQVNDRCGHPVGDQVLAGVVRVLVQLLRPYDKVYRYGGDEFVICLPGSDLAIGQTVIRRVRESLAGQVLAHWPDGSPLRVTASFGIALLDPEVGVEMSVERADQALMLAKTAGRNRAISWDPSVTTGTRLPRLKLENAPE